MGEKSKFKITEAVKIFVRLHGFIINITPFRIVLSIVITCILGILPSVSVYTTQLIMNQIQKKELAVYSIIMLCILYIAVDMVSTILNYVQSYNTFIINQKIDLALIENVLKKTKELELGDFETPEINDLISRANEQTSGKAYAFYMLVLGIFQSFVLIFSNAYILIHLKEYFILLVLIFLIIIHSIKTLRLSEKQYFIIKERTNDSRKQWYYQYLLTNDIAFKEIKLFGSHSFLISEFKKLYYLFFEQDKDIQKEIIKMDISMNLIEQAVIGGTFLGSMADVYNGKRLIGDALAYIKGISNIKSGIQSICTKIVAMLKQAYYIQQLFDFLDYRSVINSSTGTIKIDEIEKIELQSVSFRYSYKKNDSIRNVNFVLKKGELCLVVGENGSGKSTFLKLLSGYYMNYTGKILVNDIDFKDLDIENYRSKVSILLQDFTRYEMTIDKNIRMGVLNEEISNDKIQKVMFDVALDSSLTANNNQQLGYWFQNGTQLSGGQWLKIALCRTFLRPADIVMFDEPNAALDPISSKRIMEMIEEKTQNKICIISIHHLANLNLIGKKICVFKDGEIVLQGIYQELSDELEKYGLNPEKN